MSSYIAFLMFPALMALIIAGFPIAFAMISVAFVFGLIHFGDATGYQFLQKVGDVTSHSILAAVPLFIFMGKMLERSGLAEKLFDALQLWLGRLPGGLGVSAIAAGALFAATAGVVGATEVVIGLLVIPAMIKARYDNRLISGTICASGSLGTVIPPSITVIVLAPVAGVSVGEVFAGLLLPGITMAVLFALYVMGAALVKPQWAPRIAPTGQRPHVGAMLWQTATALLPVMLLIAAVLGTILSGIATPTEAAACGALGTIVLSLVYRTFSWPVLWNALRGTAGISAMILMIVLGGNIFAGVFFATGGMTAVQSLMADLNLSGMGAILVILALAFIAGFVLDLISVVLIILPIAMPIVLMFGIDPVWFSVIFLIVLQTSYLTPPMAPSIFYLRAITPPSITLKHMYWGVLPFIAAQLITLVLVMVFPQLAMWLPSKIATQAW